MYQKQTYADIQSKDKGKVHLYSSTSHICHLSRAVRQRQGLCSAKPKPTDFGHAAIQPHAAKSAVLMLCTQQSIYTWIITHLPTSEGWKAELA